MTACLIALKTGGVKRDIALSHPINNDDIGCPTLKRKHENAWDVNIFLINTRSLRDYPKKYIKNTIDSVKIMKITGSELIE